jgi:pyruvate carboxylase
MPPLNGMDIFRIFDSLNYLPNLKAAMEAVREDTHAICEGGLCYTGDISIRSATSSTSSTTSASPRNSRRWARTCSCIKDMAGLVPSLRREEAGEGAQGRGRHPDSLPHA